MHSREQNSADCSFALRSDDLFNENSTCVVDVRKSKRPVRVEIGDSKIYIVNIVANIAMVCGCFSFDSLAPAMVNYQS